MTAGAFSTPSGGYPLIVAAGNQGQRSESNGRSARRDTARPAFLLTPAAVVVAAVVLTAIALIPATHLPAGPSAPARIMMAVVAGVLLVAAAQALIAAWTEWISARRTSAEIQAIKDTVAHAVAAHRAREEELALLPQQVRVILEAHEQHQAQLLQAVREEVRHVAVGLEGRLTALEQAQPVARLEDGQLGEDERYLAGWADGLAGRTLEEGSVVPQNGRNRHHYR